MTRLAVLALIGILGLAGCRSTQALKEQPPYISYEVEGDYQDLAECIVDQGEKLEPWETMGTLRERRRPPRYIEVFSDIGSGREIVIASAIFYKKGPNQTFIEVRGSYMSLLGKDAHARKLDEKLVKPCLPGTD